MTQRMRMRMRRETWNTYRTCCYGYDVADDQRSAGGIHDHQVRRTPRGWQKRIRQANGGHESFGAYAAIDAVEGELLYSQAR